MNLDVVLVYHKYFPDEKAKTCEMEISTSWNLGEENLNILWCDLYIQAFYGQARKLFYPVKYTLFPRIHRHAVIYETADFWKRTIGFVYNGMPNVIRGLRHAVISKTYYRAMPY